MEALDYNKTPYVQLRLIKTDSLTGDVKNETVEFEYDSSNGTFVESTGATKVKFGPKRGKKKEYPINMWNDIINSYFDRGYELVTTTKTGTKTISFEGDFKRILNKAINTFVNSIIAANNEMIRESYTKDIDDIPKECLDMATSILIKLQKDIDSISLKEYNESLKEFFINFPMAVSKSDKYFVNRIDREHMKDTVSKLQEKLDGVLQLLNTKESAPTYDQTVLEANGIDIRPVNKDEENLIREWMSDQSDNYVEAYKVTNYKTEDRFNKYCEKEGLKEGSGISHLWHGTGYENLWSIFKSGMYLNPALIKSGVRICGKAFGYGVYFAPYCRKSMGYTSSNCAIHRGGGSEKGGYLLLFKVATGNPFYIYRKEERDNDGRCRVPQHWTDFHKYHPGKHCTWAEMGQEGDETIRRLMYDEVIVYQECQCTIEYIVKFSNITW